ncbi:MAG: helix-turn-helix domain-containing protein [Alphaproteobacteria bacterium]|nr:helix-turn-helix domain-containing protein [Alphaproteobacteria bacterium]
MNGRFAKRGQLSGAGADVPAAERADGGIGDILRAARERRGDSLESISGVLKIARTQLLAIEEGRFHDLPGKAYAIGFIRAYAKQVGLDPERVVDFLRAQATGIPEVPELKFPVPLAERRRSGIAALALSASLAAGVYGGWVYFTDQPENIPRVAALPVPTEREIVLATAPSPALSGPSSRPVSGQQETHAGAQSRAEPGRVEPSLAAADDGASRAVPPPAERSGGRLAQAAEVAPGGGQSLAAIPETNDDPAPPSVARTIHVGYVGPTHDATPPRVVLRADQDSWIQISERGGNKVLLARLLRAGDRVFLPGFANLRLTAGNAGGLAILVDGVAAPPLGASGVVVRNISLDGARLLAGPTVGD